MRNRLDTSINAGSMADIAFLLLLFFLVATTIEPDKGITVLLPKIDPVPPTPVSDSRVLAIKINALNQVMVETRYTEISQISEEVMEHVTSRLTMGVQPIVSILTDTSAVYNTYVTVYDEVRAGYNAMRDNLSKSLYGKRFVDLHKEHKKIIVQRIPMIVSEADYY